MLKELRKANKARAKLWDPESKTPATFAGIELGGEVGELLNAIKKIERAFYGLAGGSIDDENLRDEIGDVMICLDLLAMEYDIDIEEVTRAKFNKTSEKYGFETRL